MPGQADKQAAQNSLSLPWAGTWSTYRINQGWGSTTNTAEWPGGHGFAYWHTGIDINMGTGTQLLAMGNGTVAYVGYDTSGFYHGGYGYMLKIQYDNGPMSLYAHQSSIEVTQGQRVTRGQNVSHSGGDRNINAATAGNSSGPHLHFGLYLQGTDINPSPYIANTPTVAAGPASPPSITAGTPGFDSSQAVGPSVPDPQASLPPSLAANADFKPIPISAFGTAALSSLVWKRDQEPAALIWIDNQDGKDGIFLPVLSFQVVLTTQRAPGSFQAHCSMDWLDRRQSGRDALVKLLARTPTQIKVFTGYVPDVLQAKVSDLIPLFTGVTDPPEFTFSPTERSLSLRGPDLSGLLSAPGATLPDLSVFGGQTSAAVVRQLASRHNLSFRGPSTSDQITQIFDDTTLHTRTTGQTDWDVVTQLAEREGFVCYMDGTELVFAPPPTDAQMPPAYPIGYGPESTSGVPVSRLRVLPQPHSKRDYSVVVQSYQTSTKTSLTGTASRTTTTTTTGTSSTSTVITQTGAGVSLASGSGNPDAVMQITITEPPNTPKEVLDRKAADVLNLYQATEVLLEYTVEGLLPIDRWQPLALRSDTVPDFNGGKPYYPTKIDISYDRNIGITEVITATALPMASTYNTTITGSTS